MIINDPTKNPNESNFIVSLVNQTPKFALGIIGALLTFALFLKIVGINLSQPINDITGAYTEAIIRQAEGLENFEATTEKMFAVIENNRASQIQLVGRVERLFANQEQRMEELSETIRNLTRSTIVMEERMSDIEERLKKIEDTNDSNID